MTTPKATSLLLPRLREMYVAGVMSGTSADGIDVALARIRPRRNRNLPSIEFLAHQACPFAPSLRRAVLAAMDAKATSTAELARLNWRLGQAYAEAVRSTVNAYPMQLDLIGCHGQTVYHQGVARAYAGRPVACTWQLGEPSLLAAEMGVPVVSNFRPADMAASGQGAPLVPLLDYALFQSASRTRILQNIGGIGNLTVIPAGAQLAQVTAFDTGPGNMIMDALMQKLYGKRYDRDGMVAARGSVLSPVLATRLRMPFFSRKPPKSAGREEFGEVFAAEFLKSCRRISQLPQDAVATATAFTAKSIALAYSRFVRASVTDTPVDYFISGGGARNLTLLSRLKTELEPQGCAVRVLDDEGIPSEAKEAVAFALLAYQTWHHRPGNVPSATGATRPAILGEITYV